MVELMKAGSVIVDMAVGSGGSVCSGGASSAVARSRFDGRDREEG